MNKQLEKYDKLIVFFLVITASVLAIGWWFAEEKSAPEYSSKLDRLMFDKNNKSPKWVLTLPDKMEAKDRSKEEIKDVEIDVFEEIVISNEEKTSDESFSVANLLVNIPNIFMLRSKKQTANLKNVQTNPALLDKSVKGLLLPKISDDGLKPWVEYGNFINIQPNFKKIAIVLSGVGFDKKISDKVYDIYESEVSMSFSPYAINKSSAILTAREKGHETYADIILSSKNYLKEDTGPLSLNLTASTKEQKEKLNTILNTKSPIGGVVIRDGFLEDDNKNIMSAILNILKNKGLLIVDATSSSIIDNLKIEHLPRQKADIVINRDMKKNEILKSLKKAETIAFNKGQVLIVADTKPIILTALYEWIETFSPQISYEEAKNVNINKPFALVPVSNIVVE